ncbi:EF-hand domain-containing protein [Sphingobium sp. ZW T5_29]|uniref:EF-hand domain-containing protein n=1 Tax=Sphingobium sp. ZW T5_29 TaxID=3378077 RepID=UPI00385232A5
MIRVLTLAMLMATPALAQQAPVAPAGAAGSSATTPADPADSVASIVDREYPAYDANSDEQLDKAEFSRWMIALKDQEMKATGNKMPAADVTAWVDGAFVTADADKSVSVSKPELISYLNGGAK